MKIVKLKSKEEILQLPGWYIDEEGKIMNNERDVHIPIEMFIYLDKLVLLVPYGGDSYRIADQSLTPEHRKIGYQWEILPEFAEEKNIEDYPEYLI